MAKHSSIEWTESTWNPITGCTKISSGCKNCYAERMAKRLQAMGNPNYSNGFKLSIHQDSFQLPLQWKKPRMIFVNSMSDLFHEDVPNPVIIRLIDVMREAHWHTFQVLTKRSKRLKKLNKHIDWPPNLWMGVSVENQETTTRIHDLVKVKSKIKFLSLEPLLGSIPKLPLNGIDWVIVGGESGPYARHMDIDWVLDIRDQCIATNTPFFFKQWGGVNKKKNGRILEGETWNQMPAYVGVSI